MARTSSDSEYRPIQPLDAVLAPPASDLASLRELIVLCILSGRPLHGAEVHEAYCELMLDEDVTATAIYPPLRRLVDRKLAVKGVPRADAPGNSKVYRITERGRMVLRSYKQLMDASVAAMGADAGGPFTRVIRRGKDGQLEEGFMRRSQDLAAGEQDTFVPARQPRVITAPQDNPSLQPQSDR